MSAVEERLLDTLNEIANCRCLDLFGSYGLALKPVPISAAPPVPLLYCGVIGFSGEGIRGSLAVGSSANLLRDSNPLHDAASRDWAGELANQLMGHIKGQLLAHGVTVYLSTPTVLRGEHLRVKTSTAAPPLLFTDQHDHGLVSLWLDVETGPGLRFNDREDATGAGLEAGETLLF
jgi:hypothetical protein